MKTKILIVEDNPDCRELLARCLNHMGYEPMEAGNGHEAIALAVGGHPDLIFMDIGLPDINGVEVTALLKQDFETAQIPIVVFTAWPRDIWKEKAMKAGAADYLLKPASSVLIRRVIERFTHPNYAMSQSGDYL